MVARTTFGIKVQIINPGVLPELHARMSDLEPAFRAIYSDWVEINEQKFERAIGAEMTGADVFGETWAALTPGTIKAKHPSGAPKRQRKTTNTEGYREYPDWILVRTGKLMQAMTDPEALFHYFDKQQAIFGTPNDPDLADIVMWQAGDRQKHRYIVFLEDPDINVIKRVLQDYFSMGGDFSALRESAGMDALSQKREMNLLDAGFNLDAGGND